MKDKEKAVADQAMIREQRREAERGNGRSREAGTPARRNEEHRGNGAPSPAPTAGGVTRKQGRWSKTESNGDATVAEWASGRQAGLCWE